MIVQTLELIMLLAFCLYTDWKERKIRNQYSMPFVLVGFLTNCLLGEVGWSGSLFGILLPFIVFFPFFYLHMFRAGDIKAMMAIGAIMGYRFVGNAIFYIFAVGLIVALAKMIKHRNAKERFSNVARYFKMLFHTFKIVPYEEAASQDNTAHFPFSIAIVAGCIINLIAEYGKYYIFFR